MTLKMRCRETKACDYRQRIGYVCIIGRTTSRDCRYYAAPRVVDANVPGEKHSFTVFLSYS